jgi:hypothetical protein
MFINNLFSRLFYFINREQTTRRRQDIHLHTRSATMPRAAPLPESPLRRQSSPFIDGNHYRDTLHDMQGYELPFVLLGGARVESSSVASSLANQKNPLLKRVSGELLLEQCDYEPSVKQLRRMAKHRSVSSPSVYIPCIEVLDAPKASKGRRHSFTGGWDTPTVNQSSASSGLESPLLSLLNRERALCKLDSLPELPEQASGEIKRTLPARVFGHEAEALIASFRPNFHP